ncbi:unnamed protein product, partial [Ixodes pacificus]
IPGTTPPLPYRCQDHDKQWRDTSTTSRGRNRGTPFEDVPDTPVGDALQAPYLRCPLPAEPGWRGQDLQAGGQGTYLPQRTVRLPGACHSAQCQADSGPRQPGQAAPEALRLPHRLHPQSGKLHYGLSSLNVIRGVCDKNKLKDIYKFL